MRVAFRPDILDCIAQLSSNEVPTPPVLVNAMLDLLPMELWSKPDLRWLDPVMKSGVYLREIAKRLIAGLAEWEPDEEKRIEHIYRNMLYGTAVTLMTGEMARRTVYYSRDATGPNSVVRFEDADGNLSFVRARHIIKRGKCDICHAPESLERGPDRENYAYSFIHNAYPTKEMQSMQFDVIVGNPPWHLEDEGHGNSAAPLYHRFVEQAIALKPKYVLMITPARWYAGGKGLAAFRKNMLEGRHIRRLVDYPKLYDGFPGVKVRGGVSYFLWDRDYQGPAVVQTMWDGKPLGEPATREINQFEVFVRRNEAVSILEKVLAKNEPGLRETVSARKPFGWPTNFHGAASEVGLTDPIKVYGSQRISYVEREAVPANSEWLEGYKVIMNAVHGTSAAVERTFLSKPIIAEPDEACTETYLVAGRFDDEETAKRYADYLSTRFVRFLVSLHKPSQHTTREVYAFVPALPMDRTWTDEGLYRRYGLSAEEIEFIESQVSSRAEVPEGEIADPEDLEDDVDDE